MTDELKRRMARLREIAPRLNAATDQASRLVALVEKFLVEELHIGVSAQVGYEELPAGTDDDNQALRIRHSLAFGRVGGSFRIHVVRETFEVDDGASARTTLGQERMLWPSCTRETKLRAFEKLPELLDKIIEEAERLARTSEATRVKVDAMIGEEEPVEEVQGRAGPPGAGESGVDNSRTPPTGIVSVNGTRSNRKSTATPGKPGWRPRAGTTPTRMGIGRRPGRS